MNISIELLYGVALVKNKGVIPITDDPFMLSVDPGNYNRDNLFVTVNNGDRTIIVELTDNIVEIPSEFKRAGMLKLTIRKIINGEVLQVWQTEEILLRELDGGYEAIPQITALTDQVAALTAAVAELKNIIIESEEF